MKGINMKKHSRILAVFIGIFFLLPVRRHKPISAWSRTKYASTKKLNIGKLETQYFGYSSLQFPANFMTSDLIKTIKSASNLQMKILQDIWTKVNEVALEQHLSFDRKSIASLRF